jgi:hypothetical protein
VWVVGNPPFGRQSTTAIKFITKACSFADLIAFILPRSFKKPSMSRMFPPNFHLLSSIDLPADSFTVASQDYAVPCVFQIYERRDYTRIETTKPEPIGFRFVKKTEPHDCAVRRIGVYAGAVSLDTESKSIQSHYFIKFDNVDLIRVVEELEKINFSFDNTVGPRSLSKGEIVLEFNRVLQSLN